MAQAKTVNTVAEWSPYHTMIIAILPHCPAICTYTVWFKPPPSSLFCFKLLGVDGSSGVNIKLDPPVSVIIWGTFVALHIISNRIHICIYPLCAMQLAQVYELHISDTQLSISHITHTYVQLFIKCMTSFTIQRISF